MKRILIVENGAGFGGALTSLDTLLSALDPFQFEIHLLVSYEQDLIREAGAVKRVSVLPRKRRYGAGTTLEQRLRRFLGRKAGNAAFAVDHLSTGRTFSRAVAAYVEKHSIDLVHGNNGILINDAVILGAAMAGAPCVIHSRACEYPGRVTSWLASKVDRILAVSRHVADSLRPLGLRDESVFHAPEGLDATSFAAKADPSTFRDRHGLPRDLPLVGLVACLAAWKGHEVFLEACVDVLSRYGAGAVLVGGDPDGSGMRLDLLRTRVRALGMDGRIWCVGHESDVASAMAACEVVVHASTSPEPFGRVLLEAMAMERPVIATDAGGPKEVVSPGVDGLLVPPGDPLALAAAMASLLENPDLRKRLGRSGWEKVHEQYGIDVHACRVVAAWEGM